MDECKGTFGKIFGHKFVSLIIEYIAPNTRGMDSTGNISSILENMADKKYEIVCKRCGIKLK